ncbi:MAG TPA: ERAP1-like C-terminal domain-containing protein, partial [Kofleriaceae bacterium]|nr:ERAP1-like C-terminal domain-containing protein [Kofleriaceae bacterium]
TMAWWDDTWLNEALSEWSDMNITDAAEPSWRIRDERVVMAVRAMRADETLASHAIQRPVATRQAIEASFDGAITYLKGAAMLRMFESFVGRDAWRGFVHRYLAAHAWANASAEDFLTGVAEHLGATSAAAMRSFLVQPGVPRIAGQLRCDGDGPARLELSQTRALPAGVTDAEPRRWGVPVCVRYGDARPGASGARQCFLLEAASAVFELAPAAGSARCPSWMILNADAIGYYRSAVDPAIARALLVQGSAIARAARPTPAERMMVVEDLRAAVERGELAIDQVLELVPVIAADPDDKVARSALVAAAIPTSGLPEAMYQAARRWTYQVLHARARRLGWQRGAGESEEHHELRRELVPAVAPLDPALTAEARRLADRWLARRSGVADDLASEVLAAAARRGDAARFDRYLAAAGAARDRTEHARLLAALGEFDDPGLVNRALALVLGPERDLRDAIGIVTAILARRETRELGLAFLTVHLDELLARMRSDESSWFLAAIAGAFCDIDHRRVVADLVVSRADQIDGAHDLVVRALEQTDQCISLVERQLPALRRLLAAK